MSDGVLGLPRLRNPFTLLLNLLAWESATDYHTFDGHRYWINQRTGKRHVQVNRRKWPEPRPVDWPWVRGEYDGIPDGNRLVPKGPPPAPQRPSSGRR